MFKCRVLAAVLAVLMILGCPVAAAGEKAGFDGAVINVSDLVFDASNQAKLVISLDQVPEAGIASLKLRVHYDSTYVKIVDFKIAELFGTVTNEGNKRANPFVVTWDSSPASKNTGDLVVLTFEAKNLQNLPSDGALVTVECPNIFTYTDSGEIVSVNYRINQSGSTDPEPVDVNGDGKINTDDALYLLRHSLMADRYPVDVDVDFDGDGVIDGYDAELLYYMVA
ncbi:MAG: hypothetical protein IKV57_08200 [Clostridia bacterium]|nr:hypothetical protein [Clostridia bacterium]